MRRGLAVLAAAVGLAGICGPAGAAEGFRLTQIGRLSFPDHGYVLDVPGGARVDPNSVVVSENGEEVDGLQVVPARQVASKIGAVLVIDASDSMKGRPYEDALAAARAFVASKNEQTRVGVVAFNDRVRVLAEPTADEAKLRAALSRPPQLSEGTRIYDGVAEALTLLRRTGVASGVIVLLSDGADTGSVNAESDVAKQARASHVRIFTVGLRSHQFSVVPLRTLADDTGASYSETHSTAGLRRIFGSLGQRLASEYLLEYRSHARLRTGVHVRVEIAGFGATTVFYTAGGVNGLGPFHRSLFDRFWSSPASMVFITLMCMLLVGGFVRMLMERRQTKLVGRVSEYLTLAPPQTEQGRRPLLSDRLLAGTERSLSRTEWWARFKQELEIAGIAIDPAQIVAGTVLLTLFAAFLLGSLWVPLFIVALAIPLGVRELIRKKLLKVREAFMEQLPDNLQVLASALRAGHSFVGALAVVANDAPEPAKSEFQRVVADEQLGVPIEDSLRVVARRMDNDDVEQVALLAELQREAGGNMAEVLDTVVETIRDRFDLRRLVQTLTAQGRMARWILTALPVFLLLAISLLNPGYMQPLFGTTAGRVIVFLAAMMVVAGSLVIKRIVNIKV